MAHKAGAMTSGFGIGTAVRVNPPLVVFIIVPVSWASCGALLGAFFFSGSHLTSCTSHPVTDRFLPYSC